MKDKQCYYTVAVAACQVYKYSKTINPTSVGVNCEPHNTSYQKVLKKLRLRYAYASVRKILNSSLLKSK